MLTVIEKVIFLQNVEEFSEVSTEQLAHIAAIAEEVSFPHGETIYKDQDPAETTYLILEGQVRLHRNDLVVKVAGSNETFGSWALFDDEPRMTSATAIEETRALRIDKEEFIDLLADNVQITQGILKAMVKKLRGLVGRVNIETTAGET